MKICRNCGRELEDQALFCRYCGTRLEETQEAESYDNNNQEMSGSDSEDKKDNRTRKGFLIPAIAGGILLAVVAVGGGFLALRHPGSEVKEETPDSSEVVIEELPLGLEEQSTLLDLSQAKLVDNYEQPEGMGMIDLEARDHQPGARDISARWNKDIFYWLEDIGGEDDNHIAESILTRMELTELASGQPIEYEVYRNGETEEIQKIVSIETKEDGRLELSDYYYRDGKPDFVFRRSDSIYTPSYATIDKIGERYYFSEDQMVKWRWIYEPSVVKQWILELEDTWYTQWSYGEISDGERAEYDEKELQVLNEAYNTYHAVLANDPAAVLQGRVVDEKGKAIEEVEVGIGTVVDGEAQVPEVKVLTDENGNYCWLAEGNETVQEFFLVFRKEGFLPSVMKVPDMGSGYQTLHTVQEDVVLLEEESDDEYTVTFYAYQVEAQEEEQAMARAFAEGEMEEAVPPLADAKVNVYAGINWFVGEPVAAEESSKAGKASMELPEGVYTAVIEKEGFLPSRKVFQVRGEDLEEVVYVMGKTGSGGKSQEEGEWRILLSWNASETEPIDLDSSLFTPDKAAKGDRNCINTLNRSDGAGAELLYDGEGNNACEVITLSTPKRGSYKYYVSNYTGIQNGNGNSVSLAEAGATVTLFHNGMPVRTFSAPEKEGKVWEVFELRDQGIVPIQEVYESTEGKNWWTEDKKMARLSERQVKADWIQSDGEWLYFSNPADEGKLYYCRKDGSDLTKFSDDNLSSDRILLVDDYIYYMVFDKYALNSDYNYYNAYYDIVKVKNDGTERTIVEEDVQTAEIELCAGIYLVGYADGMIYYYNSSGISTTGIAFCIDEEKADTSVWSVAESDTNGSLPYYDYGVSPIGAAVVGNYLYYMNYIEGNYSDIGTHSFCRKNLTTGEEECLRSEVSWHPWSWGIYKGWIYYTENGVIKRTRLMGSGSFDEEQILADNGENCENRYAILNEDTYYSLRFYGDTCYYLGNDKQLYAMNLDGSGQRMLMPYEWNTVLVDGTFYTKGSNNGVAVMVHDRNGENGRTLFDSAPFINQDAMEAYARHMEYFNPMGDGADPADVEAFSSTYFACEDIDGDGISELFIDYFLFSHAYSNYYRYVDGWRVQEVWGDTWADGIVFNKDAGQIVVEARYGYRDFGLEWYDFNGTYLRGMEFSLGSEDHEAQSAAYDAAVAEYVTPYPTLKFVENTAENRQNYLLSGTGTGWASR